MSRRVLVLEDDESLRLVISKALSRAGFEVRSTASPDTALERMAARQADALVADVLLGRENFLDRIDELSRMRPDAPIVVMSAQTTAATAIGAVKSGAFEYLPKPFDLNDLVGTVERALEKGARSPNVSAPDGYADLIGRSAAMQDAFRRIGRLAGRRDPVLIAGPEGSGRAAAGRVLHRDGGLDGPLIEAGPERFAESGFALLDRAAGGSVLLRRVEALNDRAQGVLQEVLEGAGAEAGAETGPRIIATVAADGAERLRPALLDRLAIGLIEMPALRDRGADRALLFRRFLEEAGQGAPTLSEEAEAFINAQVWPGEVSQLRRTARRLAAQGPRGAVGSEDVSQAMDAMMRTEPAEALSDAAARFFALSEASGRPAIADAAAAALDAGLVSAALEAAGGVRQDAARRLGMNRNTFARKLDALIEAGKLRPDGNSR